MRHALIILLLLNVSLWLWNSFLAPPQPTPDIPLTVSSIPELVKADNISSAGVFTSTIAPSQSSCFTIGPYYNQQLATLVQDKINNYGLAVRIRAIRSMETLNFLVYIPALPDTQEAEKIVADMRRFEVKDSVVIKEGIYKDAISLGLFTNLTQAKRHAEYIRYLGYDARYVEQKAAREVFWLDYDEPFGSNTPVPAWSKVIDPNTVVQKIPRACQA